MGESDGEAFAEVLVARQPIFNRRLEVVAYELLHRSSRENRFQEEDAAKATSGVIANPLLTFGLDRLVSAGRAYINFDQATLADGLATVLPTERVVIEILETVPQTDDLIRACAGLREKGYLLALDDFVCESGYERLLELADIIKVDFRQTAPSEQERLVRCYAPRGIQMLAEKVERPEEFDRARDLGYGLFQGFFFSRPRIIASKEVPGFKLNYLRLLQEVNRSQLDFERIEEILKSEPAMVHKLLRYVNSANFGWRAEIESIRHAMTLLGETGVRKWVSLVTLSCLAGDKPQELVVDSVVRGRVCERLSQRTGLGHRAGEMFLLGMFSLIEAVLDRPMAAILEGVHLSEDVRATLLASPSAPGRISSLLNLAAALDRADLRRVEICATELGLTIASVQNVYLESVEWAEGLV